MNTSLSWIKMFVPDLDVTAQEYTDAMTLSGTKVEGYELLDADLENIVIGQIEKIEKHPDADKLIICQVNVGNEVTQIVTGAPNVKEGDKVPVVLDGGRVAGGHDGKMTAGGIKIKKGKLRGVESCGMMCSIEELGSTREMYPEAPEYGIYIFPEDAVVGESAVKALGLDDVVFEYEITSNRVDCYGVLGIAREAAATFQKKFCPPVVEVKENDEKEKNCMAVTAAADYLVTFREGYYYKDAFLKRTQPFSMQEKISIVKKTKRSEKEVDIAPMILDIREYESEPLLPGLPLKQEGIFMKLVTGSAENLKPQLVMEAFCKYLDYDYDPMGFQYHRLETYLKKDGELQPLGSVGWEITEEKHPDEEQKN